MHATKEFARWGESVRASLALERPNEETEGELREGSKWESARATDCVQMLTDTSISHRGGS